MMDQRGETIRYTDRTQAGISLAQKLAAYAGRRDVIVLALPRGGVSVAFEIARALEAPLDVLLVRKLGVPGHEEYAMGAIAAGGVCILQSDVIRHLACMLHKLPLWCQLDDARVLRLYS